MSTRVGRFGHWSLVVGRWSNSPPLCFISLTQTSVLADLVSFVLSAVSTKVDVRFNVLAAKWLPNYVKEQLVIRSSTLMNKQVPLFPHYSIAPSRLAIHRTFFVFVLHVRVTLTRGLGQGELVVTSSKSRSQAANIDDAIAKLQKVRLPFAICL